MKTILIGCGNPLRGDDGAASAVISMLKPGTVASVCPLQLTPEIAAELAGFDRAIFLDADPHAAAPALEPLTGPPPTPALTHAATPAEILHLARVLFQFRGEACLLRIPARDFSPREGLSPACLRAVRQTCVIIEQGEFL